ncbi:MAG: Rieske 2Fe-2S domain-containing protein [Solirubrobacteraceae bacterium]
MERSQMDITFLGQAGLFIRTRAGSILCDPWFNPAYFASWFPFPANYHIDPETIGSPDYLYVSHLHHDHFDPEFLREHVSKDAQVLLPDYPVNDLERELRDLGFQRFIKTQDLHPVEVDGLLFTIVSLTSPTDGPIGDSALVVDDGETRVFNQNDAHPLEADVLRALGPFDAHFLQFSGAIWFPMVYRFRDKMKQALTRHKREQQSRRALQYASQVGATHVFPTAGPPCFLDDDLFDLNDLPGAAIPTIFLDQSVFLEYMGEHGDGRGRLVIPGSVVSLEGSRCEVSHPVGDDELRAIFEDKEAYLRGYQAHMRPVIAAERARWPRGRVDILSSMRSLIEPLLHKADHTCGGVNARILFSCGTDEVVIDFLDRRVYRWDGENCRYRFFVEAELMETVLETGEEDWVNSLFLSCRFEAERDGKYNEYVYNFFKCLSYERLQYLEGYYAEATGSDETWECAGYRVQRRCPHMKADLTEFGEYADGILTCMMHGHQFELATGRCLTSDDMRLRTEPINGDRSPDQGDRRQPEATPLSPGS